MGQGAAFRLLLQRITATISDAAAEDALREFREALQAAVEMATDVSTRFADIAQSGHTERFLANASAYLDMPGHVVIAWNLLQQIRISAFMTSVGQSVYISVVSVSFKNN